MNIKEKILFVAKLNKTFKTADVVLFLNNKVSRKWISFVISSMVKMGQLVKSGSTAGAKYALPENSTELGSIINKHLKREGLKEHEVLNEINNHAFFLSKLDENIRNIFDYAFSEMLNNAIEHSKSQFLNLKVGIDEKNLWFEVSDDGIGVFRNVMAKRNLVNEFEAMQDILKGRITTHPRAHSGEGIFFTSKAGDLFILGSFGFSLRVDNNIPDIFFEENNSKAGTKVTFSISRSSKRHLTDIFSKYETDHDDPEFDKTEIYVKLFKLGTIYISRSQARRILSGLEKFKHIILNFDKVPTVGQSFADEIFRVFQNNHKNIQITNINMNEAVKYMIDRVSRN